LAARPSDRPPLAQVDGERDLHRCLDTGAADLPVTLHRMTIAEMEERALDEHRQVHRHALAEPAIVHIAAVLGRRVARDRLPAHRRDAEAAEHGTQRYLQALETRHWLARAQGARLGV